VKNRTIALLAGLFLFVLRSHAAPIAFRPAHDLFVPAIPHGQEWSIPMMPIRLTPPVSLSEAEIQRIAPPVVRIQPGESGIFLNAAHASREASPVSAVIGVLAGTTLLMFAYGFIPHAQSQILRLRALHLRQDLLT